MDPREVGINSAPACHYALWLRKIEEESVQLELCEQKSLISEPRASFFTIRHISGCRGPGGRV